MLEDFKNFLFRGNIIELAVAFVMGVAFAALVNSFVESLIMPIVAMIIGEPDFRGLTFTINDATFYYGAFITDAIQFVAIAAAVFFFVVKPMQAMLARGRKGPSRKACRTRSVGIRSCSRRCPLLLFWPRSSSCVPPRTRADEADAGDARAPAWRSPPRRRPRPAAARARRRRAGAPQLSDHRIDNHLQPPRSTPPCGLWPSAVHQSTPTPRGREVGAVCKPCDPQSPLRAGGAEGRVVCAWRVARGAWRAVARRAVARRAVARRGEAALRRGSDAAKVAARTRRSWQHRPRPPRPAARREPPCRRSSRARHARDTAFAYARTSRRVAAS